MLINFIISYILMPFVYWVNIQNLLEAKLFQKFKWLGIEIFWALLSRETLIMRRKSCDLGTVWDRTYWEQKGEGNVYLLTLILIFPEHPECLSEGLGWRQDTGLDGILNTNVAICSYVTHTSVLTDLWQNRNVINAIRIILIYLLEQFNTTFTWIYFHIYLHC